MGASFVPVLFLPETFKPVLLRKRAYKLRKKDPGCRVYAPIELEKRDALEMVTVTLARPIRMFFGEPIVLFSSLYLAFASAIYCKSNEWLVGESAILLTLRQLFSLRPTPSFSRVFTK